jgi:hypothetical protein
VRYEKVFFAHTLTLISGAVILVVATVVYLKPAAYLTQ